MQSVNELLAKLDNTTKNEIENTLVEIGTPVVSELVSKLQVVRGMTRGVVAMTLIRIGNESVVESLEAAASKNKDFEWVAEYLISEIKSTKAA